MCIWHACSSPLYEHINNIEKKKEEANEGMQGQKWKLSLTI